MTTLLTRRSVVRGAVAAALGARFRHAFAQTAPPAYSYPIGWPGRALGAGFLIRHGYATENTWYNPGWLHAGEDWYATEGDTAGAGVYASAAGEVAFAGSEYPGRVVIVRHADDLYSMYGHLDYALAVAAGQAVDRGQLLGTVLARIDGRAPSHLHFEVRTFFTTPAVNGTAPRHGVACGYECPPGPGYWPIAAPEHPSALGWRNPTHVIAHRAYPDGVPPVGAEVVADASGEATLHADPGGTVEASLPLRTGDRFALRGLSAGPGETEGTSAEAYDLWYRIALPDGADGWVQAALPSALETGADGRPSTVGFTLLPWVVAARTEAG